MLVDPLVLKKKLNRMATEQGAFAVLSSLLLYVTELAASDPQLSNKRTKWAEGKENKVSYNQPCPDPNRAQHPTRFQLLRSRFLNNNREPYTKKRREVGKLVIKEKLWVNRAGNKLDRSRDRKGDGKAAEEDADTVLSERARWSCTSGKNTVKNILKKFLAAEEKEKKENSPSWKKKGPNSSLPKIVNKSSVLSKLKEKFEQSALCSAAEVKASLLSKGEKKTKNFPSRKTIRKPEVRVLRVAAMTATGISTPESQYLVCSTVPVPKLSIATKINRPWSWSKNNATKQPFSHDTALKGSGESLREPGENETSANAAQDSEDKEELLVTPRAMYDAKDHAEDKRDSTKQGHKFTPNLDSSSTTQRNKYLADCIPPLSEHTLDCDRNNVPAGADTSSLLGINNAVQHVKEDNSPSNSPYSSTAEGSHEQSSQDTKRGEIPEITMYVYSSEEADTELTEPENNLFFTGQKCFPEQKALENILPCHSPGVQTCCEVEPPVEDGQITLLTPASVKRPPIVQTKAPDLRGRCSEKAKEGVKYHSEYKISSTSTKNDNDVPTRKEEENRTPNSQMQNESKTEQPQPPQTLRPQNNFPNSNVDISNPDANQTKSTLSSKENQEQKPGAAEKEHISSHLEKSRSPLSGDFVKHSSDVVEEDFGKDKLSSSNEMMNHTNNRALHRSTITDLETHHKPSKSFIEREEATADEMPCLDSEACQSLSSTPIPTSVSGIAEQRIHHSLGNPPDHPPIDLVRQGDGGMGDEHASHGCEKHSPPSSDKLTTHGNDTTVENKTACDFKNQVLSPNHATDNENSTAEETNACQRSENCLSLSTKKPGKHENKTVLAREPLLPLEKKRTPASDDTTKQGSDVPEENLFPSSTELISDQKNLVKGRNKVSKHTKDKLLSSDDDMKHESDGMETDEREERNVLHKSEEQVFTPRDAVDHDNNSSNENAQKPQTSQLPSSEHDINTQGMKNTEQNLKHLTPSRDFVEHKDDTTVDENICCNNGKHRLSSLNEPMKYANDITGETNIKSNFSNYSMPPRNTSRQDNKTADEENTSQNLKNEPVQHKKSCEGERNTSGDPKNQTPLTNRLRKQDKKLSPLKTQKQVSPDDNAKPENKLAEKKTEHTSEKLQPPSDKVLKPQERSSSGERKKKTAAAEDTRVPETKAVKKNSERKSYGNHQLPPSSKQSKPEKNTPGGEKQQTVPKSFTKPNASDAKDKTKDPGSGMGQSPSSKSLVKSQEKNTTKKNQLPPPPPVEKTTHKTESPEKKSGPQRREKYQLHSSAQSEKHSSQGSEKEGPVGDFKSYQAPLPGDGINCKSSTPPKKTSLSNTEKASKPSSFPVASKDEENPAGNRKNHPGLKKYQVLSSKNLVRQEKDVAERERSCQAAGKTREKKAEPEDCSKAASFSKYTVESYSESPLDSSFKPLIIRVTDTFKHHS